MTMQNPSVLPLFSISSIQCIKDVKHTNMVVGWLLCVRAVVVVSNGEIIHSSTKQIISKVFSKADFPFYNIYVLNAKYSSKKMEERQKPYRNSTLCWREQEQNNEMALPLYGVSHWKPEQKIRITKVHNLTGMNSYEHIMKNLMSSYQSMCIKKASALITLKQFLFKLILKKMRLSSFLFRRIAMQTPNVQKLTISSKTNFKSPGDTILMQLE